MIAFCDGVFHRMEVFILRHLWCTLPWHCPRYPDLHPNFRSRLGQHRLLLVQRQGPVLGFYLAMGGSRGSPKTCWMVSSGTLPIYGWKMRYPHDSHEFPRWGTSSVGAAGAQGPGWMSGPWSAAYDLVRLTQHFCFSMNLDGQSIEVKPWNFG